MPDKDGNETYRERQARLRDERILERLTREAEQEKAEQAERIAMEKMGKSMDKDLQDFVENTLGASLDEIQKAFNETPKEREAGEAALMRELNKARQKGDQKKVKKLVKQNKGQLKKIKKRRKGCLGALIVMAAVGTSILGGLVYGAVEVVSALIK